MPEQNRRPMQDENEAALEMLHGANEPGFTGRSTSADAGNGYGTSSSGERTGGTSDAVTGRSPSRKNDGTHYRGEVEQPNQMAGRT